MDNSTFNTTPKHAAEDTDAGGNEEAETRGPFSFCVRVNGFLLLSAALILIIYGVFIHEPGCTKATEDWQITGCAKGTLEKEANKIAPMELTAKPKDEVRNFEFTMLPNGVQAVTVQDKRALQQAFAAAVEVGSFDDPWLPGKAMPGLAHFCEHMVFLGTEKYKEDQGFDNFMAAHGGYNNAFTSSELTVYYAAVSEDAAAEGFDRFADLIKAPLFDAKWADKEVHAVDSEHAKNIQNRYRQVLGVLDSLAVKESPLSRFHTGNIETLKTEAEKAHVDPVKALKEYWETHYCPERIKVVTVASDSNAEQLKRIQKEFGDMTSPSGACKEPRQMFALPAPYPPERLQKFVNIQGMQPRSFLWLHWPLPDVSSKYASAPLDYIKYVMVYGGENSLSRILKDVLNLATGVKIDFSASSAGTQVLLECQLTKQGRANTQVLLDVIFAYIALLHRDGVHEGLYTSLADAWRLKWDWGGQENPTDTASQLAERMTQVKPQDLLWADGIVEKPDRELVRQLLAKMTPSNMNVALMNEATKEEAALKAFFNGQEVKTLKHFSINYTERDFKDALPEGSVAKWEEWIRGDVTAKSIENSITAYLKQHKLKVLDKAPVPKSPITIQGIPKSIKTAHMHAAYRPYSSKVPIDTLLYGPTPEPLNCPSASPFGKEADIWFRSGWMKASPMVKLHLSLKPLKMPDEVEMTPLQDLELELYGRLFSDALSPKLYESQVVGMEYNIDVAVEGGGLDFTFAGLQPNMPKLIRGVLKEFNSFNDNSHKTPELRWTRIRDQLREDLTSYTEMPVNYAIADRNTLLTKGSHSRAELIEELDKDHATLDASSMSVSKILLSRQLRLTGLAMGNMGEKDAKSMIGGFLDNVKIPGKLTEAETGAEVERVRPIVDPRGPVEVRKMNPQDGDTNNVAVVSVIAGVSTVERRVLLGLLSSLFKQMAYNYLRTESMLGYVATAGVVLLSNVQLMSCVVQGDVADADAMEAAIHHLTLDLMPKRLADMTDGEFNAFKSAFRHELQQPPMKLKDEFSHFRGPVDQGGIGFDLLNEMLRFLEGPLATKEALQTEWQKLMFPSEGERSMVAVKYFAKADATAERTLEQATKTWVAQNVSENGRKLLEREFKKVQSSDKGRLLTKIDSEERKKLVKAGGWFPSEQHLKLEDEKKSASKEPLEVPQLLKNLDKVRKEEIDTFQTSTREYTTSSHANRHESLRGLRKSRKRNSYPLSVERALQVDAEFVPVDSRGFHLPSIR